MGTTVEGRTAKGIDEALPLIADDFRAIARRPEGELELTGLIAFMFSTEPDRAEPIRSFLLRTIPSDLVARIMGTLFHEYVAKGVAIGRAEGRSQGPTEDRAEDRAQGEARRIVLGHDAAAAELVACARRSLRAEEHRRISAQPHERTIFDEYVEEGIARGRAEGEARDRAAGRDANLVEQLEAKFGPLPATVSDAIVNGTPEEISVWTSRIVFTASLDEVFAARS